MTDTSRVSLQQAGAFAYHVFSGFGPAIPVVTGDIPSLGAGVYLLWYASLTGGSQITAANTVVSGMGLVWSTPIAITTTNFGGLVYSSAIWVASGIPVSGPVVIEVAGSQQAVYAAGVFKLENVPDSNGGLDAIVQSSGDTSIATGNDTLVSFANPIGDPRNLVLGHGVAHARHVLALWPLTEVFNSFSPPMNNPSEGLALYQANGLHDTHWTIGASGTGRARLVELGYAAPPPWLRQKQRDDK